MRKKFLENDPLQNILAARLVGIKALPIDPLSPLIRTEEYLVRYREIRAYYVGIEYLLKNEKRGFYNGVNYRLYVLAPEEGCWVIIESSEAPVNRMLESGYGFGTLEEKIAYRVQEERARTGRFINSRGEVLEAVPAGDHPQPNSIRVARTNNGAITGQIDEVDFYTYVTNVLPNEWIASWPAESLRAGALAVKMYGWYRVFYPKYPLQGFDVRDDASDQVYKPGTAHPNTTLAVQDEEGIGVDRADGRLFETQYNAGDKYTAGNPASGKMSQWGTKYLAEQGWGVDYMVHYYYDNSENTGGQLSKFFDYNPNRSPNAPYGIDPPAGAIGVSQTPTLRASAFSDPDPEDSHWKTRWWIYRASDGGVVWDTAWRPFDLTSTMVPAGILLPNERYQWQARYMDNQGAGSLPQSPKREFTTGTPMPYRYYIPFVRK